MGQTRDKAIQVHKSVDSYDYGWDGWRPEMTND